MSSELRGDNICGGDGGRYRMITFPYLARCCAKDEMR